MWGFQKIVFWSGQPFDVVEKRFIDFCYSPPAPGFSIRPGARFDSDFEKTKIMIAILENHTNDSIFVFGPIFYGRLWPTPDGCAVVGRFLFDKSAQVLLGSALALLAFAFFHFSFSWMLVGLSALYLLTLFGWVAASRLMGKEYISAISRQIERLLE